MRSALGLRRIGDIDVSQVLRASTSDVYHLQSHLRRWGIPSFSSYALLLRALTHPSISNWAERVLQLPKRSLGPNTLELLGDRVVGVCVASAVHRWLRPGPAAAPLAPLQPWSLRYGPSSIVASLVANRGLAHAARRAALHRLIRWEKALPPAAHRTRLDHNGVDAATGIPVNRDVNALAAAYEAVAAAVYLDAGFHAATTFVHTTLLQDSQLVRDVQQANAGLKEYEELLVNEVADWVGVAPGDVRPVGDDAVPDGLDRRPLRNVQCGVVDLQPPVAADKPASPLYYAGVVLRPAVPAKEVLREPDLFSVSSHFSIEMARIAAALQAVEALQGKRPASAGGKRRAKSTTVRLMARLGDQQQLQPVELDFEVDGGKWVGDGDYLRVARSLDRVDVPGMAHFSQWDCDRAGELRQKIQDMYSERNNPANEIGDEGGHHKPPRRRRSNSVGSGLICERTVAECLDLGQQVHSSNPLHQTHPHFSTAPASALDICSAVHSTIKRLNGIDRWWQVAELRGYNCVGAQVQRLWSVQQSMRNTAQDRSEVVGPCESRMSKAAEVEQALIAGDGLDYADSLSRVRKGLVGLGIVVQDLGTNTALQWLSGAEVIAGMRKEEESGAIQA